MNDNESGNMDYLAPVLREAQERFAAGPSKRTAGRYLRILLDAQGEDIITDDDALDGIYTVIEYLEHGRIES